MSEFDKIMEEAGKTGFKFDMSKMKDIKNEEFAARAMGEKRLNTLEKLSGHKVNSSYREGFLQGFYEAMFPVEQTTPIGLKE